MIDALSVLLSRLTAARTAFLDAAVTSIAAAATAVSNATWTAAKAAFLDAAISTLAVAATAVSNATWTAAKAAFLDATVSTRMTTIKSIQVGTVTQTSVASATATITSVNVAKALLIYLGASINNATSGSSTADATYVTLTNGTTVTAVRGLGNFTNVVQFMVIEFN